MQERVILVTPVHLALYFASCHRKPPSRVASPHQAWL